MKLNIGCGDDYREGWVNADIRPLTRLRSTDRAFDAPMTDIRMTGYLGDTFDEVLARDVLEHVERNEVEQALSELRRVLKPSGKLCIRVPNLLFWASRICADPLKVDQALEAIYGEQNYDENYHKSGFTVYSLAAALKRVGFVDIEVSGVDGGINIQALCRKAG